MITIYIPGLALKGYEYRRGDAQIIHDDAGSAIVIDGGEAELCNKIIAYCKNKSIKHITYILTHWHYDHDVGMKTLLDSSIIVDRIYCPPPSELKGLQEKEVSEDYARAQRRITLASSLKKPIVYPTSGVNTEITVGEIRCRIWRRAANKGDKNDYEVNNTSICTYFPDLYYLTTGDTINSFDIYLSSHKDTVKVFKIPHHGNACTTNPCEKLKTYGAQFCWYNDFEPKGAGVGSTGFSMWGAGYCKKYFATIRTDADIIMTAANHVLKVQKGSSIWTYQIPYNGKGGEGWINNGGKWSYQFADGSFAVGWNELVKNGKKDWFYFNPDNGVMLTGWYFDKGFQKWYYLDPSTGAMQKGKAVQGNGYWYYLDGYGQMITGWHDPKDGFLRYLEPDADKNQGHMYVNCTAEIDGKTWVFDGYGRASQIVDAQDAVELVIQIAKAEVGYKEKASNKDLDSKTANAGTANYTKYGRDMHSVYPKTMDFPAAWCDAFVDWCFYRAFGKDTAPQMLCGTFDDYTVNSASFYKKAGRWFTTPAVGDQIFFKDANGICHTGLVYRISNGKVYTIEGNSSNQVRYCEYAENNSKIAGYGRPRWELASQGTPAKKTIEEVAREVIAGKWGVGDIRKQLLAENGYDYNAVQAKVNELLKH